MLQALVDAAEMILKEDRFSVEEKREATAFLSAYRSFKHFVQQKGN